MRSLSFWWVQWLAEHPFFATFAGLVLVILFFAMLPLIFVALPVQKVPVLYNLRNLQTRWLTTFVTALAFTAVTALLTVMLAFVNGMRNLTENSGDPRNIIVLSEGATDEAFSNLPKFTIEQLPRDLQRYIEKTADQKSYLATQEVYVVVTQTLPNPTAGRKRRFVQMRGFDNLQVAAYVHAAELELGEWPSPSGYRYVSMTDPSGETRQETVPEVVLGGGIARIFGGDYGKAMLVPGDLVEIGPKKCYVVGVLKATGSSFDSETWTYDSYVQESFGRKNSYSSYCVRAPTAEMAAYAAEELRKLESERKLQAQTEKAYYSKLTDTNTQFTVAIYFVAIIMAIGGMLGIMNTMFAAISQRSKDIGVLRLMGFTRSQIFLSFQAESIIIAILGGLLGVLLGSLFHGMTATSIVTSGAGGGGKGVVLKLIVDGGVVLISMTFAVLMGCFGGVLPSINAIRLRPLESLR